MNVLGVAENHMSWLAARQLVASSNLANADTPGFKAQAIQGFGREMDQTACRLAATHARHLDMSGSRATRFATAPQNNTEVNVSGNDVVLEKEMRTIGENARLFSFDLGLMKSFHRMVLTSVKG